MRLLQDMRMPLYMPDQADVAPRLSGRCSITCKVGIQHRIVWGLGSLGWVSTDFEGPAGCIPSGSLCFARYDATKFASLGIALASSYRTSRD